jgi:hypothetical protein
MHFHWVHKWSEMLSVLKVMQKVQQCLAEVAISCPKICFSPCPNCLRWECQLVNELGYALPTCHGIMIRGFHLGDLVILFHGRHRYGPRMFWSGRGSRCHKQSGNDTAVEHGGLSKQLVVPSSNSYRDILWRLFSRFAFASDFGCACGR